MTSGSIMDVGMTTVNVSGSTNKAASAGKDNSDSFAKTMQSISGSQNSQNQNATINMNQNTQNAKPADTRDTSAKTDTSASDKTSNTQVDKDTTKSTDTAKDKTNNQQDVTEGKAVHNQNEEISDDVKDAIVDAAEDMIQNVATELDVSEEDVKAAMETLGLQMIDILNPDQLNQIVAQISGEDMVSLMTDENLYTDLQNLTGDLQETLQNLTQDLNLSEEELQSLLDNVKTAMTQKETLTTVLQPVTPEELANKEDTPFLATQESQNIIDFRKDLTAQSEKTTPAEQQVQESDVKTQDTVVQETQNSGEKEQTADDSAQKEPTENLTGFQQKFDQTAATEEVIEEPVYETPDTESILKQLADYMKTKVSEDMTQMEMQLHPASLGTVNLQIASKAGAVTAQFSVQNEEVKQAMETQVAQLKQNLEEQGVKVEAVEVTVASHSFEKNSESQNQEQKEAYEQEQNKIKPIRRRILNLNDYTDLEGIAEEEDDAVRIAMEMMAGSGNTLDMLA